MAEMPAKHAWYRQGPIGPSMARLGPNWWQDLGSAFWLCAAPPRPTAVRHGAPTRPLPTKWAWTARSLAVLLAELTFWSTLCEVRSHNKGLYGWMSRDRLRVVRQGANQFCHVGRQFTGKVHTLARSRVLERQFGRVQRLALQPLKCQLGGAGQPAGAGHEARTVDSVSQQGMAEVGHVHPDLVRAAGFERKPEQAGPRFAVAHGEG